MSTSIYDIIAIGGGLAGSAVAKAMAERGARVLVLERVKDRVRGEFMVPWGVAESQMLGIHDVLKRTCSHELRWMNFFAGPLEVAHRDLIETTAPKLPALTFYHPAMQEALLCAAEQSGAAVRRGVYVRSVTPGPIPTVEIENDGHETELRARLVVGADGRSSSVRKWGNFEKRSDPERLFISGVLLEDMNVERDGLYWLINTEVGQEASLFPQADGRVRAYFVHRAEESFRMHGRDDVAAFIEKCIAIGAPADYYAGAEACGPLATFCASDSWVEHPYKNGVALVGDAAAASDPAWGQGTALAVRDVRILCDQLCSHDDWDRGGHAYAAEHDRHYGAIHTVTEWLTDMFYAGGEEADETRRRALPVIASDGTRMPSHVTDGPDMPVNETVKRRFFAET
jgi:menaquinone-9 beta-reductase